MLSLADRRLYGIVDLGYLAAGEEAIVAITQVLLDGDIDVLQLRAKGFPPETITRLGRAMLPLTRSAGVPLIINDHARIAADIDADGVHLGQDDGDLNEARAILGSGKFIGRSTHSPAQAGSARDGGADYIGFGPIFATPTKPGRPAIGSVDLAAVHAELGAGFPIYCIGGIKSDNASALVAAGARRLVIVSGLLQAADVPGYIREVKSLLPNC